MADVTRALALAASTDVRAMATYMASLSSRSGAAADTAPSNKQVPEASPEMLAIFTGACANCHSDGNGVGPSKALPLSLSSTVRQSSSANVVRVILQGIQPRPGAAGAYMPAFGEMLTDQQIAALADYVRARYSNGPQWTDVRAQIATARQ
jgi:mono/diheme cytochrome c family protein